MVRRVEVVIGVVIYYLNLIGIYYFECFWRSELKVLYCYLDGVT